MFDTDLLEQIDDPVPIKSHVVFGKRSPHSLKRFLEICIKFRRISEQLRFFIHQEVQPITGQLSASNIDNVRPTI